MLKNMEHSRRFESPRISGENAENTSQNGLQPVIDTGNGKVSFDVLAEYNPPTLEERKAEIAAMKHSRTSTEPAPVPMPRVMPMPRQPAITPNQPARPPFNPGMRQPMPGRPGMPGPYRPALGPNGQPLPQPQGGPQ
jgi:type IV pilus assembly protein PilN